MKSAGSSQSASVANLSIWVMTVKGMIPGMMGMSDPRARTRSTSSTHLDASKNSCVMAYSAPAFAFSTTIRASSCGSLSG